MKIAREEFKYPSYKRVSVERDCTNWLGTPTGQKTTVEERQCVKWDDFMAEVQEFINGIGPVRLVNISEESHWVDGSFWMYEIMVWYWREDEHERFRNGF